MKLRHKTTGKLGSSDQLNVHSMNEIIVYYEDDCDSEFIKDFDIELGVGPAAHWKDLREAFVAHDVITDNFNTRFFEPTNEEDKSRGYAL